jgi:plastocyanin
MSHFARILVAVALLGGATALQSVQAADTEVSIVIQNHKFTPSEVRVPAGQRVKLLVLNKDDTPEEFESAELGREKVIPAGNRATIFVGPLKAGRYPFVGEFHQSTAQGVIIAE